jgi:hypothetical protein
VLDDRDGDARRARILPQRLDMLDEACWRVGS